MKRLPVIWALAGVTTVFLLAGVRLGWRGVLTIQAGLSPWEWASLGVLVIAFFYGEGVRTLERRYAPFVVNRARKLSEIQAPLLQVLAPLYAMALVGADGRMMVRAWAGVTAIAGAVLIVRGLPEPWRGIVDLSVALALAWGALGIVKAASRPSVFTRSLQE